MDGVVSSALNHAYKISSHVLKLKLPMAKIHLDVINDYMKPVAKIRYRIGQLYDMSKHFLQIGMRLHMSAAHSS